MDRAGIERSLLIAVRAGDINMKGGFELPYERVHEVCRQHPARFSGLAGIDPFRGMQGLRDLEQAVREYGFVGAHLYPHWCGLAPGPCQVLSVLREVLRAGRPDHDAGWPQPGLFPGAPAAVGRPAHLPRPGGHRFSRSCG